MVTNLSWCHSSWSYSISGDTGLLAIVLGSDLVMTAAQMRTDAVGKFTG
jgi:hypothetical protein